MNKLDKNKQIERAKVEPLGDIRIGEARSKLIFSQMCLYIPIVKKQHTNSFPLHRFLGTNEKRNN